MAELAAVGYAALRLEDVATRASVAKTTVYRRWATKAELVQSAIYSTFQQKHASVPDTGTLRGDLLALLDQSVAVMETAEGRAIATMVTTERADPDVDRLCRRLRDEGRQFRSRVVVRAQERGEIPSDVDPVLMVEAVFGVVMSRLVRFGERTDRAACERLVDLVVTGAEHGGGKLPRTEDPR